MAARIIKTPLPFSKKNANLSKFCSFLQKYEKMYYSTKNYVYYAHNGKFLQKHEKRACGASFSGS